MRSINSNSFSRHLHNPIRLEPSPSLQTNHHNTATLACPTVSRGLTRSPTQPHPFPLVQPPSASPARSPLPSARLVVCASSRRGRSRPAPRGFSAREAMRGGVDSEGRQYASADEMWRQEAGERAVSAGEGKSEEGAMEAEMGGKKREWYDKGVKYWECVEASVDGVLGGYGAVSSTDAAGSAAFLHEVYGAQLDAARSQGRPLVALDCGAGIGRVTKEFLLHVFNEVDLVEPVRHFIDAARDHLASPPSSAASPAASHRAVNFFCCPLQEFSPDAGRYDVVWVQWCIGHLTDADLIAFLHRCLAGLRPGGIIVLKENTCQKGFVLDKADSSVTRSDAYFRDLFKQANLQLLKSKVQRGFPSELFVVKMYALAAHPTTHGGVAGRTRQRSKRPNQPAVIY